MPNFCQDKLIHEIGNFVTLSLRNGNLVQGIVLATFNNKVQVGGAAGVLTVINSAGVEVTLVSNYIEIPCNEIVAASGGLQQHINSVKSGKGGF